MILLEQSKDGKVWERLADQEIGWLDLADVEPDYELVVYAMKQGIMIKTHKAYYRKRSMVKELFNR